MVLRTASSSFLFLNTSLCKEYLMWEKMGFLSFFLRFSSSIQIAFEMKSSRTYRKFRLVLVLRICLFFLSFFAGYLLLFVVRKYIVVNWLGLCSFLSSENRKNERMNHKRVNVVELCCGIVGGEYRINAVSA